MKKIFFLIALFWATISNAQATDETRIRTLLSRQTAAWNRGDLDAFMEPYWQNDSLMFVGKGGVTWGWKNTLEQYKKSYPGKEAMGQLSFDIIQIKNISKDYFHATGKWVLRRTIGDLSGHFTLLIKNIGG